MTEPRIELDHRFSSEDAIARPWREVLSVLETSEIFWLSTVRRDGRPHVTPLPAIWLDDALHFCTGPEEQKTKNIELNPYCVLTTGINAYRSGLDVVVEGRVTRVTDDSMLERLAALWRSKLDWPFEAVEGGFRETGAVGDPDDQGIALVFGVSPTKILAFGKGEPFSQTRYLFQ